MIDLLILKISTIFFFITPEKRKFAVLIESFNRMDHKTALLIRISGLVQGVGFRPFVYRMALKNKVQGWVENNNEGVLIHAEAAKSALENFINDLQLHKPVASSIHSIEWQATVFYGHKTFSIKKSENLSDAVTEVSPDIAVCPDCLDDMKSQPHRMAYPFINCTNCGPRFTIIRELPYDRHLTSMSPFEMCVNCAEEYTSILDRRFHAQPVACLHCGPAYVLYPEGKLLSNGDELSGAIAAAIMKGEIVALKGLGGYHLLCDAFNQKAVETLRKRKNREGKPLAIMLPSLETARKYFHINETEAKALNSWRRPITLLKNKAFSPKLISIGLHVTGVVLPYMPLHFQLFGQLKTEAIVLTSGNLSDEPVVIDDKEALQTLFSVADLVVGYNRDIHNRADDSVLFVAAGSERLIRRSRGYAPAPVPVHRHTEGIFAAGAELSNTFAIGKGENAIFSQHIGDLKNAETLAFYEEAFHRFSALFRFKPELVVCDSHPDYLSSQFANSLDIQTIEVQHHHAHIASCMAEHGLDEKLIGIAFDGTGWGTDGSIWGSEFFVCDLLGFERKFHFNPIPLAGGDKVTKQPWRTTIACLYQYFGPDFVDSNRDLFGELSGEKLGFVLQMLSKNLNCPMSSGAGRLFDAVAALIGLCSETSYHAEAPMLLEANIKPNCKGKYLFDILDDSIVFNRMFHQINKDLRAGTAVDEISAKFHNTVIAIIVAVCRMLREETGLKKVVLSGGTFQNRYLLENSIHILSAIGFEVFTQSKVPSNDGGIALGQLAIAAKMREVGLGGLRPLQH